MPAVSAESSHDLCVALSGALSPAVCRILRKRCGSRNFLQHFSENEIQNICRSAKRPEYEGKFCLERRAEEIERRCTQTGITINGFTSPMYPAGLRHIFDPPEVIYSKGVIPPEWTDSENKTEASYPLNVAVVGTRFPHPLALHFTRNVCQLMCSAGMHVVSGLARGVDTEAHSAALSAAGEGSGKTQAVLGCGVDCIYPQSSRPVYEKILSSGGCIISEYPPGTEPLRHHFPRRNRIISGLSDVILMVQAADRSGALITVNYGLEHGKDIYAFRGIPEHEGFSGNCRIINEGAHAVYRPEDFFSLVKNMPLTPKRISISEESERGPKESIIAAVSAAPHTVQELSQLLNLPAAAAASVCMELLISGVISELPGQRYYCFSAG